jgi:hypothetical protein
MNIDNDRLPISSSVVAAFRLLGALNAGTPLAIASTPVRAVHPDANARSARNTSPSEERPVSSGLTSQSALSATGASPNNVRNSPQATMPSTPTTNRYVGSANARPDSRTPRRFAAVRKTTNPTAIGTRPEFRAGAAEMMLSTPADTETATVRT